MRIRKITSLALSAIILLNTVLNVGILTTDATIGSPTNRQIPTASGANPVFTLTDRFSMPNAENIINRVQCEHNERVPLTAGNDRIQIENFGSNAAIRATMDNDLCVGYWKLNDSIKIYYKDAIVSKYKVTMNYRSGATAASPNGFTVSGEGITGFTKTFPPTTDAKFQQTTFILDVKTAGTGVITMTGTANQGPTVDYFDFELACDDIKFAQNTATFDSTRDKVIGEVYFNGIDGNKYYDVALDGAKNDNSKFIIEAGGFVKYKQSANIIAGTKYTIAVISRGVHKNIDITVPPSPSTPPAVVYNYANALAGSGTWVFTGADQLAQDATTLEAARTFVGQFEEYVRTGDWGVPNTQRFITNTAVKGQTIAELNVNFDNRIGMLRPKGVVVMVDKSDYSKGDEYIVTFKAELTKLITKIADIGAIPLILSPVTNTTDAANVTKYTTAINEVTTATKAKFYNLSTYTRVPLAGQDAATYLLNKKEHYAIGKLLIKEVTGATTNIVDNITLDMKLAPDPSYIDVAPTISVDGTTANIIVAPQAGVTKLQYELYNAATQVTISAESTNNTFTISGLTAGTTYKLNIKSIEGKPVVLKTTQFVATKGSEAVVVTPHTQAAATQIDSLDAAIIAKNASLKVDIANIMASPEQKTWLFIGDSITHGIYHTRGYDSVPQLFEMFLDENNRGKDIVVNAAVSGATAPTTMTYVNERINAYKADVAIIMLGTNDANGQTAFAADLPRIVDAIKATNPDTKIYIRTPYLSTRNNVLTALPALSTIVRQVAKDKDIGLIDNYQAMLNEAAVCPSLNTIGVKKWHSDNLHPNIFGNLTMFKEILKGIGQYKEDSYIAKLNYEMDSLEIAKTAPTPTVTPTNGGILTLDVAGLKTAYTAANTGKTLESVTLNATKDGVTTSITATTQNSISLKLTPSQTYSVKVTGIEATSKLLPQFAATNITTLGGTAPADKTVLISNITTAQSLLAGATEGTLVGNYILGSKDIYKAAIDAAVVIKDKATASQDEVGNAITVLSQATTTFESSKETTTLKLGDVNGNAVFNLEDVLAALKIAATVNPVPVGNKFSNANADKTTAGSENIIDKADVMFLLNYIVNE